MSFVFNGIETNYSSGLGMPQRKGVRIATTIANTLASSFVNNSVIDGVTIFTNDRILIKNQASGIENGIYTINASGAPTRDLDYDIGMPVGGTRLCVLEGNTLNDSEWQCTNTTGGDVVGTHALVFAQLGTVVGATPSTNNGISKFTDTSGKQIASTSVLIDVSNNISTPANISLTGASSTIALSGGVNNNITMSGGTIDGVKVSSMLTTTNGSAAAVGNVMIYNGGTSVQQLPPPGISGYVLSFNTGFSPPMVWTDPTTLNSGSLCTVVSDQKPTGTAGGDFIAAVNTWRTRVLNTLTDTAGGTTATPSNKGVKLLTATNRLVIPAGIHFMVAQAQAFRVDENRTRFQIIGQPQVTRITIGSSVLASSVASKYFFFNTGIVSYYLWIRVNSSADPAVSGTSLPTANLLVSATAVEIATAIRNAVNTIATAYASSDGNTVVIRNTNIGATTGNIDGNTGFTITSIAGNNTTSTVDTSLSSQSKNSAQGSSMPATIVSQFTFNNTKICELQHICATSKTTDGFGFPTGLGTYEQYTTLYLQKIANGINGQDA